MQAVQFDVRPGATTPVQVTNRPQATVAFWKVAPDDDDGPLPSRAGATFEVTNAADVVVGACTTDLDGTCTLAGLPLDGGARYCWREVVAPPGWGLAEPGCFDAGQAGSTTTIRVLEPRLPTPTTAPTPAPTLRPAPAAAPEPEPATPLPRTGATTAPVAAMGAGLVLVGGALMCSRAPAQ